MEIKFNKGFSTVLITILIIMNVFGQTGMLSCIDLFRINPNYDLSILDILISSLASIFKYSSNLVTGVWLFIICPKLKQEKWSWFLLGLTFGFYSLIFLTILLVIQSKKTQLDLFKAIRPVLVLLLLSFFLEPASNILATPVFTRILSASDYFFVQENTSNLQILNYGIVLLINIVLAIKLHKRSGQLELKGKFLWTISTILLGLFPVILFNELILYRKINNTKSLSDKI